jgi:hypothetical protein
MKAHYSQCWQQFRGAKVKRMLGNFFSWNKVLINNNLTLPELVTCDFFFLHDLHEWNKRVPLSPRK